VVEPLAIQNPESYKKAGFRLTKLPFLATKTVVIDVSKPVDILWKELSENAKRLIKKNKDLKIIEADKKEFYENWTKWTKVWIQSPKEYDDLLRAFGKRAKLWVAKDERGLHSGY